MWPPDSRLPPRRYARGARQSNWSASRADSRARSRQGPRPQKRWSNGRSSSSTRAVRSAEKTRGDRRSGTGWDRSHCVSLVTTAKEGNDIAVGIGDLEAPQAVIDERQLLHERRAPPLELVEQHVGVQRVDVG